ncbi:hypothetical protein N6B72_20315 [Chryseobacterium soli]|uniref:beta strand repeat-containing protein n=1 Tax=Chryseobacterium soli TaxID=445961 RepID=UPI00295569ED|nr:hypothetical protein [Chryseobacterium soli]MDV7699271.1 hypothetical protein [Chryseobacterium soli]
MKKNFFTLLALNAFSIVLYAQSGNVGINTPTPGTTLDINGAITNRETVVSVSGNSAVVPSNVSQIQLTGIATAIVAVTAPAPPNSGQRLIIYNNSTGGFGATLNGFSISNGQTLEFSYSNGNWRATNGGADPGGTAWNLLGSTGTVPSTNFLGTTDNQDMVFRTNNIEKTRITANGNVGVNTPTPGTTLDINGAITNRETAVAVSGNSATVPANVSQVQLTGAATASVAITAPSAPNAGQRLIIYNNTTGGFGATLNGFSVPNGQALEFSYSNGNWRATNGGVAQGGLGWGFLGNTGTVSSTNFLGTTDNQDMVFRTNNTEKARIAANGNVGIGTQLPTTSLDIVNAGTGSTIVSASAASNTALKLENSVNGQAVIQNFTAKNASGVARITGMGINPNFSTNGIFVITRGTNSDFLLDLSDGHIGIGTTPDLISQLYVTGTAGAGSALRITDGTQANGRILVSDANGLASWKVNNIPTFVLSYNTSSTVLSGVGIGGSSSLPNFVSTINTTPGISFIGNTVTLAAGVYQVNVSLEFSNATNGGDCGTLVSLINSYFLDFPNNGTNMRVHSNSPSNCGGTSNHSAQWNTTISIPAGGATWVLNLGRGQGGNYTNNVDVSTSSRILLFKMQ